MTETGVPDGWDILPMKAFGTHVGPFYRPTDGNTLLGGFLADERHGNLRGVVHGGMIATAFDTVLGMACIAAIDERPSATVQLGVQFVGALQFGEFACIRAEIVRMTRSLVFMRGTMTVDDRVIATADGVWKILVWRESGTPA